MLYYPSLSVFASCFTPWALTACTPTSAHGFALISKTVPVIVPVCAAAFGANAHVKAINTINDTAHEFTFLQRSIMPSPFAAREPTRLAPACAYYLHTLPDAKLKASLPPSAGNESDPAPQLRRTPASATNNCRRRPTLHLRSDSRTTSNATARRVPRLAG